MSEIPPPNPPPPGQFVQYPRGEGPLPYGSIEKLEALGAGYFGLNNIFLINVVLVVGSNAALASSNRNPGAGLLTYGFAILVLLAVVGAGTYPYNKKIAYGKDWPDWAAPLASLLMGLNSALCCGIIGYIVMQNIAMTEMRKYGFQGTMFGLKKKVFQIRVEALRAAQNQPNQPPPPAQFQP